MPKYSLTEANKLLFQPIIKLCDEYGEIHSKHCIAFSEPREKERSFYKKLSLKSENMGSIIHGKKYTLIQYNEEGTLRNFLAIVNIDIDSKVEFDTELLSVFTDHKAPFFLLLASNGVVEYKKDTLNDFYEERLHTPNYNKFSYIAHDVREHRLEEIEDYFYPFLIIELISFKDSFDDNLNKLLLYFISSATNLRWLPYDSNNINAYKQIALTGNSNIPYIYILSALTAIQWKYAFKDLYRCIERLYPIGKISSLTKELTCLDEKDEFEIASTLEKTLGWRSDEESSLIALVAKVDSELIERISSFLVNCTQSSLPWSDIQSLLELKVKQHENIKKQKNLKDKICEKICSCDKVEKVVSEEECAESIIKHKDQIEKLKINFVAREIYKLRNSFVHYRDHLLKETEKYQFNDAEWNELIGYMLELISNLFDKTMYNRSRK